MYLSMNMYDTDNHMIYIYIYTRLISCHFDSKQSKCFNLYTYT